MEQKDAATFIILVIAIIIFFLTLSFYKRVRNKRKLLSIDDHYEFIFKLAMENDGELNVVKLVKSSPYNYRLAHQYLMQSHQNGLSERVYLEEGEESYIFKGAISSEELEGATLEEYKSANFVWWLFTIIAGCFLIISIYMDLTLPLSVSLITIPLKGISLIFIIFLFRAYSKPKRALIIKDNGLVILYLVKQFGIRFIPWKEVTGVDIRSVGKAYLIFIALRKGEFSEKVPYPKGQKYFLGMLSHLVRSVLKQK